MIGVHDQKGEREGLVVREQSADFRTVVVRNIDAHGQQKLVVERTKVESPYAASTDLYLELWDLAARVSASFGIQFAQILGRNGETVQLEFVAGEGLDHLASYLSTEDQKTFLEVVKTYLGTVNRAINNRVELFFAKRGFHRNTDQTDEVSVVDKEGKSGWWFVSDLEPKNLVLPGVSGVSLLSVVNKLDEAEKKRLFREMLLASKVVDPLSIAAEIVQK